MSRSSRPFVFITLLLACLCAATATAATYYDPPGRVARLSHSQGDLSYSPAGEDGWYRVERNRPLVRGDRLWTDRGSLAEFQVGSAAVRLDQQTSLEILELNDRLVQLELSQGSLNLHVRRLYQGQEFEVATPSLAFVIDRPGNYRIDVDPRHGRTTIVVWQGAGVAYGDNGRFPVRAGDAVSFYGSDLRDYDLFGLPRMDAFDRYCFDRDRRLERSLSLRYLGDDVIGYSDLDDYGYWRPVPGYGNVWFPSQVGMNWAPYRDGRWIWQEPWGWTWVDDAPWGFAPSHYGRWAHISNRWGWIPGPRDYRPYYAPALVVFIGGHGWSIALSLGGDVSIGWFPLGPHDVYMPPYQASRDYFSQVNVSNTVINNVTINNVYNNYSSGHINVAQTNYVNRAVADAVTAVPAKVFVDSRPVRPAAVRLDREALQGGELTRVAPIAPRARSVLGAEAPARARPNREALERPVFVRTPPPASERPFVEREKQLQQKPGRPLETRPEPRPQDALQRNLRVIKDRNATDDARAAGPRRRDATPAQTPTDQAAPVPPTTPPPLDRTIERRPPPVQPPSQSWQQRQAESQRQDAPPRKNAQDQAEQQAQAETQAEAQARARARDDAAQARAEEQAKARAEAQARADAQQARARDEAAQANAEEQARARDEAAQARAEQQAQARAEAQARADAQARAREEAAQARAEEQARARAETAVGDNAAPASQSAEAPAKRQAQSAAKPSKRHPPNCLTPEEVEALTKATVAGEEPPAYVPCKTGGD